MHAAILVVSGLLALIGLALLATGALGLTRRLPGNSWLGVRTPETRKSPEAWQLANRAAGPGFIGAGAVGLAGAIGPAVIGGITGWIVAALAVPGILAMLAFAGLAGSRVAAMWQAAQDREADDGCCGSGGDSSCSTTESCDETPDDDPSRDCGVTGGCGTCSLKGMCETEPGDAPAADTGATRR